EVGVEDRVPIIPRYVDRRLADVAAGVVHENVNLTKLAQRVADRALDARMVPDIELDTRDPSAHAAHLFRKAFERCTSAARDRQIGPGACQCSRELLPQTAA